MKSRKSNNFEYWNGRLMYMIFVIQYFHLICFQVILQVCLIHRIELLISSRRAKPSTEELLYVYIHGIGVSQQNK